MNIRPAVAADITPALDCLVQSFADDPITGFLLQAGPGYPERLRHFFSLLMRARIALGMPVRVADGDAGIAGAAMGYATVRPAWPSELAAEWDRFEAQVSGLGERMAVYDGIADPLKPTTPHYYLGVIGTAPQTQGAGVGTQLLQSFCSVSAADPASSGVYLETANPANVRFYERAGFVEVGRGRMGGATLWCMFLAHPARAGG